MAVKCPKCDIDNPSDSKYCKECAMPLPSSKEISPTKTLETPTDKLSSGITFAGRYEIIEELGKGGMGRVYRVKDEKLDEEMALKVLKPEIAADKGMIERFKNELKLARKIAHKSVCRMYDLNEEEDKPYITMEYVKGEDLKSYIRRKAKLSKEETIAIAKQVCEGLEEAHELGVIHRDLKPQNIMIDEKSNAKVMDFGIARSVEAPGITHTGMMIGTPDYMSPEQAEGEETDQRSDIYALGVILFEMVTGRVPFKGDTALSVALKHKAQLPLDPRKLNPEVSEDLSRLILICMEKDKERRYQKAEELLADLRNIEEGLPLGTKIRPRRETFIAALIRKKLFIPALVAALAIIAAVIWQPWSQREAVPIPSDRPSLAVMYFKNNTGDQNLDHWRTMLSNLLIADLTQSKHIRVLSEDKLFNILSKLNQLEAETHSSGVLKQVAAQGRINHILQGAYAKAGEEFRINVMLQEANTGELIGSESVAGKGEESIFSMVDELTRRIKANFKLSGEEITRDIDKDVGKITTSSHEAYKYYSEAREHHIKGESREAIPFYEKAIAIDPDFAMAYRGMALAYGILGYLSKKMKYLQKALELSDRVAERELYKIQGSFYTQSEKTNDKAIEALGNLVQIYPNDMLGHRLLGRVYRDLEQWDKALEQFEVNIRNKIEVYFPYINAARAYGAMGMYENARDVLVDYLNNFQDLAVIRWNLARNYLAQGKYDLAHIEVDRAISLKPALFRNYYMKGDIYHSQGDLAKAEKEYQKLLEFEEKTAHLWGRDRLGALNLSRGKFAEAKKEATDGTKLAEELGEKKWKARFHRELAYLHLNSGQPEKALEECDKAMKSTIEAGSFYWQRKALCFKGLSLLEMEALDKAQRAANDLKELDEKGMNKKAVRYYHHLMGRIQLERENFSSAIENFEKAISLLGNQYSAGGSHALFIESLALAYYRFGNLDKAEEQYKKIISLTSGRISRGDIYAKSFYMLGMIYEQKGWKGKAIEHYEKFLDLWKDADAGIAEVEDTRERLAGLKGQ